MLYEKEDRRYLDTFFYSDLLDPKQGDMMYGVPQAVFMMCENADGLGFPTLK